MTWFSTCQYTLVIALIMVFRDIISAYTALRAYRI